MAVSKHVFPFSLRDTMYYALVTKAAVTLSWAKETPESYVRKGSCVFTAFAEDQTFYFIHKVRWYIDFFNNMCSIFTSFPFPLLPPTPLICTYGISNLYPLFLSYFPFITYTKINIEYNLLSPFHLAHLCMLFRLTILFYIYDFLWFISHLFHVQMKRAMCKPLAELLTFKSSLVSSTTWKTTVIVLACRWLRKPI